MTPHKPGYDNGASSASYHNAATHGRFEYRERRDGPGHDGDPIDWWAVEVRDGPLESWSTVPRRFVSRAAAQDYIDEQDASDDSAR